MTSRRRAEREGTDSAEREGGWPTGDESAMARARGLFRTDGPFWRTLARWGAEHAPMVVVRHSPPLWALAFTLALPRVRSRVRDNLRMVRGVRSFRAEQVEIYRTFSSFARCLTEGFALNRRGLPAPRRTVTGAEHLEAARRAGRGLVLLTAHTAMWEIAGSLLKELFPIDLLVAMQGEQNEASRRIQDDARRRMGIEIVHVGTDPLAALPLVSHLRRGGAVGIQFDRAPPGMRVLPVRLFDRSWPVPRGPFELARLSGAAILPVFTRRRSFLDYEVRLFSPLVLARHEPLEALARAAQKVATDLEGFIREEPTQWFHFVGDSKRSGR